MVIKRVHLILIAVIACIFMCACSSTPAIQDIDYLILVNDEHKLPDYWESTVNLETTTDVDNDPCEVEKETLQKYYELRDDLQTNDGIYIEINRSYISVANQQDLWDRWSKEAGGEIILRRYAEVPGFSEHHTGLAIDICLVKDGTIVDDNASMMVEREIFRKIHAKLANYGFILRYPEDKEAVTGYAYEPWHIRFVGSPEVAKEITDNGLTLEEYLRER